MKPEDHRSKLRKVAVVRGRMYLKSHLGFLPGFPLRQTGSQVAWMPAPGTGPLFDDEIRLTDEHLRRATFGWTKLSRRFPRALPRIVGVDDVDAWKQRLPKVLDMLGRAVHEESPLPESLFDSELEFSHKVRAQAANLIRKYPGCRPLIGAWSWAFCLSPSAMPRSLSWLEANDRQIHRVLENLPGTKGIVATLALWSLADRDGPRRGNLLLAALGSPGGLDVATHGGGEYLEAWNELLKPRTSRQPAELLSWPERPRVEWAAALPGFMAWLQVQPTKDRRRAFDLFELAFPADLLPRWHAWWQQVEREVADARPIARKVQASAPTWPDLIEDAGKIAARLETLRLQLPPAVLRVASGRHGAGRLPDVIRLLSQPAFEKVYAPLLRILRCVDAEKDGELPRIGILAEVVRWSDSYEPDRIAGILQALQAGGISGNELPRVIRDNVVWDLFLFDGRMQLERAGKALAYWLGPLGQRDHLDWPIAVSQLTGETRKVQAYLRELAKRKPGQAYLSNKTLECAAQIAVREDDFAQLAHALEKASRKDWHACTAARLVAEQLAGSGWRHLVSELVLDGDLSASTSLATLVQTTQGLGGHAQAPPYPDSAAPPDWAERYPAPLRPALAILAAISPDARQTAANVLDGSFPAQEKLQEEMGVVQSSLAADPSNAHLAKRLENLCRRLEQPQAASERRIEHLGAKIQRAIRRRVVETWQAGLRAEFEDDVIRAFGLAGFPDWLGEERRQRSLAAILQLEGWARTLGLRLFRLRCGPPPWNLADEPANQKFIARLRNMGIDPTAWISPPGPTTAVGPNGRRVQLNFEQDPLEIFLMGEYFGTCLGLGDCNFFSTVANAADINKHVVFARGDHGQVVGRCLLAISERGGLMAFHPYCQDPELGFAQMIADLVKDLAGRMQTQVVLRGKVLALVADDWYDDGAIDLGCRFSCLEEGSALRRVLPNVALAEVVSLFESALAPVPLNALTLPLVLDLPEFQSRPELLLPFLPRIERTDDLALDAVLRAAGLARRAGALPEARRLLRKQALPLSARNVDSLYEKFEEVVAIDPTLALRLIRASRPRGVRKDEQEEDYRRNLLAKALTALGRVAKANRLTAITARPAG